MVEVMSQHDAAPASRRGRRATMLYVAGTVEHERQGMRAAPV